MSETLLPKIAELLDTTDMREVRAQRAAEAIRAARNYRWAGIYDVGDEEIEIVGHTGVQAPAFIHIPVDRGLGAEAVRTRSTVIGNDGTGSEIVVPILGAETGLVIGMLDVESERKGAFSEDEQRFLETCARALMPLFE